MILIQCYYLFSQLVLTIFDIFWNLKRFIILTHNQLSGIMSILQIQVAKVMGLQFESSS